MKTIITAALGALLTLCFACGDDGRATGEAPAAAATLADSDATLDLGDLDLARAERSRLRRTIKCSDDGRLCLECYYKDNGDLLYCDVWILPAVSNIRFDRRDPLRGKSRSLTSRAIAPGGILRDE